MKTKIQTNLRKQIQILIFLIGMFNISYAQDIITLKNGDEIKAKVNEIDLNVVKYKKFDNQNGPIYSIDKEKIFMIKYENGSKDVFTDMSEPKTESIKKEEPKVAETHPAQNLSKDKQNIAAEKRAILDSLTYMGGKIYKGERKLRPYEVKNTMISCPSAVRQYKAGRTFNTLGVISASVGLADALVGLAYTLNGTDASQIYIMSGLECCLGLILTISGDSHIEKSVGTFNECLKKSASTNLSLGLTRNGIGLCLKF